MTAAQPSIDNWDPLSLEHAAEVFADAPYRWWICGGMALELFVESGWRPHYHLDIGVLRTQANEVHGWPSSDWELWIAQLVFPAALGPSTTTIMAVAPCHSSVRYPANMASACQAETLAFRTTGLLGRLPYPSWRDGVLHSRPTNAAALCTNPRDGALRRADTQKDRPAQEALMGQDTATAADVMRALVAAFDTGDVSEIAEVVHPEYLDHQGLP